jgi:outer membrane receptor protein involved in Fe transport
VHFNQANYVGVYDRHSAYAGGVGTATLIRGRHRAGFGVSAYADHENQLFVLPADGSTSSARTIQTGAVAAAFAEDAYKPRSWLTLYGGLRFTHYSGGLTQRFLDPRAGAAVRLPRTKWVLHGFYGRYYQPPPLLSVTQTEQGIASAQGFTFLPLKGEQDWQYDVGLSIPIRGWGAEIDQFQTWARNYFDHDALGNSSVFFPLTLDRAHIRGWEVVLRAPRLPHGANFHLAYSRQVAEGHCPVSGGLLDLNAVCGPEAGWFFLDHDQRHTLSAVGSITAPRKLLVSTVVSFGSGFLDGDGPQHLPAHTTFDVSVGRSLGERLSVRVTATNVTNATYLLDNSNTFGGTHFAYPREVGVQVKYRFHY